MDNIKLENVNSVTYLSGKVTNDEKKLQILIVEQQMLNR